MSSIKQIKVNGVLTDIKSLTAQELLDNLEIGDNISIALNEDETKVKISASGGGNKLYQHRLNVFDGINGLIQLTLITRSSEKINSLSKLSSELNRLGYTSTNPYYIGLYHAVGGDFYDTKVYYSNGLVVKYGSNTSDFYNGSCSDSVVEIQ